MQCYECLMEKHSKPILFFNKTKYHQQHFFLKVHCKDAISIPMCVINLKTMTVLAHDALFSFPLHLLSHAINLISEMKWLKGTLIE